MVFAVEDMYFASGSAPLRNCWTENVTKHDTSSFYNYEEDNQPIHDLEERTYLAWERLGFPTSSIPGMVLTVSGDADLDLDGDGFNDCHTKLFNELSSCIASLPERINFPITIEVGSHGDLGGVEINGLDFGPSGSLEIVNRNFAKGYSDFTQASAVSVATEVADYDIIDIVSSFEISATFADASCLDISATVLSANTGNLFDPRMTGNTRAITQFPGYKSVGSGDGVETTRLGVSISTTTSAFIFAGGTSSLQLPIYEEESDLGSDLLGDVSSTNLITGVPVRKGGGSVFDIDSGGGNNNCQTMIYNNYLRYISIEGCNGPVYLRNFFVDGHKTEKNGVTIRNSSDVLLENFASVRCTENGYLIENSQVIASRGLVAYRCYGFSTGTTRLNQDWIQTSSLGSTGDDPAAGLHLINSNLTISSTLVQEQVENSHVDANDYLLNFSRCSNGIVLENSVLQGGISRGVGSAESATYLNVQLNAEWGIKSTNSLIDLDGRLKIEGNSHGMLAINSEINIDEFEGSTNQHEALNLRGSTLRYGKNKVQVPSYTTRFRSTTPYHQITFFSNGQNIIMDNSDMDIVSTSSLDQNFGKIKSYANYGTNSKSVDGDLVRVPEIEVKNNSKIKLVHYASHILDTNGTELTVANGDAIYGLCLATERGSHAIFQGSNHAATLLVGPNTYSNQKRAAGVYAEKNSSITFNGPTVISKFAVDVLAEENSVIDFGPPRDMTTGAVDVSSFDLDLETNHTAIELHSTKACVVVNKGSTLNLKDIGDFEQCWASGSSGQIIQVSGPTYDTSGELNLAKYTSAGSMQFYPNPNDTTDYADGILGAGQANVVPSTVATFFTTDTMTQETDHNRFLYYHTNAIFNPAEQVIGIGDISPSNVTGGGVCVRAVNGSHVNAQNVNFPAGMWNPSGPIYDSSSNDGVNALLCDRLFIWNIADNSTMHASFLAVSGLHGLDAAYHGPSGVWGSGTNGAAVTYGVPAHPDTSSLSILDAFGKTVGDVLLQKDGAGTYPISQEFTNFGPFRIYVSVPGFTNYLTTSGPTTEDIYGAPAQIFAQGYQASAFLSAAPSVSAIWDDVVSWNENGNALITAKFFYTSAMLDGAGAQRIILDQSAANVFANAKHGASGKSGRQKIFSIYDAHQSLGGEGATNTVKQLGRGFKSSNAFDLARDE